MDLPQLILFCIVWLVCSCMIFSAIADIPVYSREVTRKRWVRILLVLGGTVTAAVFVVTVMGYMLVIQLREALSDYIPRKVRAFMEQPPSIAE